MKYKLVYIEWEDATSIGAWQNNKQIDEWNNTTETWGFCKQVGWIIRENKRSYIIAGRWNPENKFGEEQWGDLEKIPKTWIRKKIILKV